jgi:putative hydrolase of the HAD superfamily
MAVRAVLLDALGTLVRLEPPGPHLRARLQDLSGVDVGLEVAERGFAAEIAHYLAHHMEGGDRQGLERLRDDCAAVMHEALGSPAIDRAVVRRAMVEALEFSAFPDAKPALRDLRARGLCLVVASNWDCSLPEWLEGAGLWELVEGAASSAVVGEAKPSPAVFHAALELAGVEPGEAVHVGDSLENDVKGARAAGIRGVLVDRSGAEPVEGVETVGSLGEVASLI